MSCIDVPQRLYSRFPRREACQLIIEDQVFMGRTIDISEGGTLLELPEFPYRSAVTGKLEFTRPSPLAGVVIPVRVSARNIRIGFTGDRVNLGVEFLEWNISAMRLLIPHLYCQPNQWQEVRVPESKTLWAMLLSVFRFYPLSVRGKLL